MIRCPRLRDTRTLTPTTSLYQLRHSLAGGHRSTSDTTRVVAAVESPEEITGEDLSADDVSAINQLRPNSALLIVRQGPAAGARFLVNSDVTTAGRHPRCIFFRHHRLAQPRAFHQARRSHLGRGRNSPTAPT